MTQNIVNYANNPTGPELLDDYLAKEQQNNLTSNSGIQRPSYVQAGTKWLDTSSTPWVWKMFDGSSDVILGTVDPTTHTFNATGLDTAVLLTGNQTVGGVKTFSNNPLVPNITSGDNSSKAANTAFVAAGLATKQNTLVAGRNIVISGNEISSTADSRNIGEIITSTIPLTDAGLHLLDGTLLSGSGSYSDFVDYMADLYDGGLSDIFCPAQEWEDSVTNYGSCGKFVYDSVNNTVRLPKYTNEHGALIYKNNSGNSWIKIYEDGWCIQGNITSQSNQSTVSLLKSFVDTNYDVLITTNDSTYANYSYGCAVAKTTSTFDISVIRSGSGITALVYWEAKGYVDVSDYQNAPIYEYVVVANSTKIDIEVDIDEIASDLNGKADVDLSNCTKPHVVETYSSGTDWYRIWSDGWCEQGGEVTVNGSSVSTSVTLLSSYSSTDYSILAGGEDVSGSSVGAVEVGWGLKTTSGFTIARQDGYAGSQRICWEAKGYIS